MLKIIWNSSQNIYLFQRIIHNENGWVRPVEGRLGFPDDGSYLCDNGIGHEDWNFNTNLTIADQVYGYLYYEPATYKQNKNFNIVFATLDEGRWSIVGFYQNARFVPDGCPIDKKVFPKKVADLEFLREQNSLGEEWALSKNKIELKLRDEFRTLRWQVHFKDIFALPAPIDVSNEIDLPGNKRITTCTTISEQNFFRILQIAKSTVPTLQGVLTSDELANRQNRNISQFSDEDEDDFPEGKIFYRKHRFRERNATLIKNAKSAFLKKHGKLFCECCKFDFEDIYGPIGTSYIEAHHIIPVSDLKHRGKTKIEEIALLCSNCHRMIHRKRPWLALDELKNLIKKKI